MYTQMLFIGFIFGMMLGLGLCKQNVKSDYFDYGTGNTSVLLSATAYCDRSTYLTHDYSNLYTDTFVPTMEIYDEELDVNGFIGYREVDTTIYVVYEGSHSTQDWINDFTFTKVSYESFSCQVHKGFYDGVQAVITDVISEVKRLQEIYPSYRVVTTGHSLGAALATLTAVDLVESNIPAQIFNFGSPRIFDEECAKEISALVENRVRVTHYKDIVPYTPLERMEFMHISGEWYEDNKGNIVPCESYEDDNCADQWSKTNPDDHMWYLGFYVGCNSTSSMK
jgi:hypothetical protein